MRNIIEDIKKIGYEVSDIGTGEFLIHDYYFLDNGFCYIKPLNNRLQIKHHAVDNWKLLESVEELVFHQYYEYFLLSNKLEANIPPTIKNIWDQYLDSSDSSLALSKKRALLSVAMVHTGNFEGIKHLEIWNELARLFPEFVYEGIAYRAIACDKTSLEEGRVAQLGNSWAITHNGIVNFLNKIDGDLFFGFHLYTAKIKGFSIYNLYKDYKSEFTGIPIGPFSGYVDEEEVIALEVSDLSTPEFFEEIDDL